MRYAVTETALPKATRKATAPAAPVARKLVR
jgi:hypothetical protein